jgi:hypothetical protein
MLCGTAVAACPQINTKHSKVWAERTVLINVKPVGASRYQWAWKGSFLNKINFLSQRVDSNYLQYLQHHTSYCSVGRI